MGLRIISTSSETIKTRLRAIGLEGKTQITPHFLAKMTKNQREEV